MTNTRQSVVLDLMDNHQLPNPPSLSTLLHQPVNNTSSHQQVDDIGDMTNTRQNVILDLMDNHQLPNPTSLSSRVLEVPPPIQPVDGNISERQPPVVSDPLLRTQRRGNASHSSGRVPVSTASDSRVLPGTSSNSRVLSGTSSNNRENDADRTSRNRSKQISIE